MADDVRILIWADVEVIVKGLAARVLADGAPQVIVAIARGGMIPAVLIAHALGVRDVRSITITHTKTDGVNAAKTPQPLVTNPGSLGDLCSRDVLLVDDITGSGDTQTAGRALLLGRQPTRVRTAVLWQNTANWQFSNCDPTYVGEQNRGWVVFPWETATAHTPASVAQQTGSGQQRGAAR